MQLRSHEHAQEKTALTVQELLGGTLLSGAAAGGIAGYRKGGGEGAARGALGGALGAPVGSALGGIGGGLADHALGTRGLGALGVLVGGVGGGIGGYKALTHGVKKPPEEHTEKRAFFDELVKLGAVTDEQAQRTLDRLEGLERNRPDLGQLGRYAMVGAVAGPAIKAVGNLIKGRNPLDFGGTHAVRGALGEMATGALSAGAIPVVRHRLDRRAATSTLRDYLQERSVAPKVAFQVSQYSGPLSEGAFKMTSGLPPVRVPPLTASPVEKPKTAGLATTPNGQLASARAVGLPKVTSPGGSVAALAKPKGFGTPLPGATNPNSLR